MSCNILLAIASLILIYIIVVEVKKHCDGIELVLAECNTRRSV